MAEQSSNEYTPLDLSMKDKASPSTSRDGTQDASSTFSAYTTIWANALRYQGYTQHMPMTFEACNVAGITDNGSSSCQHLGSIRRTDKAVPSTIRAGMEQASANIEDAATNAPGTGGREQRELCGVCGNACSRLDALHVHAKEPTDDAAHICKACDQSSVKKPNFVEHCRNRTDKKHKCETCGKQFRRADYLVIHYRTHTDERPYKCKICDKSFRQYNHLDQHKRTHTDERPYKCQICNKSFRAPGHLDNHKRTHTDERPYKCQMCDKSYRQSNHLDRHKREHTGEKPYICKTCGKSYTREATLRKHEPAHAQEKRHACEKYSLLQKRI
ncbi:uncharacterized protein [Dermacentor andersoni]|uniref:uncharacterized protein n=1 Tax=Dermacentor andersoni TaxID=34620 RepID=UPI003B3A5B09